MILRRFLVRRSNCNFVSTFGPPLSKPLQNRRLIHQESKTTDNKELLSSSSCSNKAKQFNTATRENVRNILSFEPSPQLFQVYGWVRKVQKQKRTAFVHLDDGSGPKRLQLVIPNELLSLERKLTTGSSICATGRLVPSSGSQQPTELLCESLDLLSECDPKTYSIGHLGPGDLKLEYLRERIHLRPRVRYFQSLARLRSELHNAIQIFMKQEDFLFVTTPMVTANDCEGGGECFTLNPTNWSNSEKPYFGRPAFLTVSGQLHLEAMASALSRVYTVGPVFRAEKSMSPKHLSEFTMLEAEEAFIFSLDHLLDRVESMSKFFAFYLERNCPEDIQFVREQNGNYSFGDNISNGKYVRMTYEDALNILEQSEQFKDILKEKIGDDGEKIVNLNAQMERTLVEAMDNRPVFVTHYPKQLKPFYMKTDGDKALCFDLLLPICGEVCGGSLREDNIDALTRNIAEKLNPNEAQQPNLDWYLDLRQFGHAPLGGFGLGFDRFVQSLTGVANVKDVVPFPRWPYHCYL